MNANIEILTLKKEDRYVFRPQIGALVPNVEEYAIDDIVAVGLNDELAFGRGDGARQTLYRVRFAQTTLWPDYDGPAGDTIDIELYEHWLEPATE